MESKGIGQYVDQWKIRNKMYSPNPQIVEHAPEPGQNLNLFTIKPEDRIEVKQRSHEKRTDKPDAGQNPTLPL